MKALIQRVSRGSVTIDDEVTGRIGRGYVVLLGVSNGDSEEDARYLAHRTVNLRIFPDTEERMNLSIQDIEGEILIISQFTLCADTKKGNRPGFANAAPPEIAQKLYNVYVDAIRLELGDSRVSTGVFRAMMSVEIINDGPVTIELSSSDRRS
jgi:D-tyrosyl-tRNA(Tyr) deacylase